jgi:hypothetical protein
VTSWPLPAAVITKHYTQLKQIADDVDDARVYGGIHWRFDQEGADLPGTLVILPPRKQMPHAPTARHPDHPPQALTHPRYRPGSPVL